MNTSAPSLVASTGDCWQSGALETPDGKGLTPDILPGDTVSLLGGTAAPTSVRSP